MQARAAFLVVLLAAPALAGCTVLNQPRGWDLTLPLGILVSDGAGIVLQEVSPSAELATRQWADLGVGVRFDVSTEAARDGATAAFDRLVDEEGVALVVAAVTPDEAAALSQRASQRSIPLLLATPPAAALAAHPNLLQVAPPPEAEPQALADLVEAQGADRIVLFATSDVFATQAVAAFGAAYNGTIVDRGVFDRDRHNAITTAARLACEVDADGVVVFAPGREAGWIVRGLVDGGCRDRMQVFAASSARQAELVEEAGGDGTGRSYAAGVLGVEPPRSRIAEFRALFLTETGRTPSAYAAEAYDAVSYATLAAFTAKGSARADPVRATITAADVREHVLDVAEPPGVRHTDRVSAANVAKRADPLDWVGYAHDFAFSDARAPAPSEHGRWTVTRTGGIESVS